MAEVEIMPGVDSRFTKIANSFCRDKRVTPRAARVFIFLRSHVSGWRLTVASIAMQLGMSKGTVASAINDLEELGYVRRAWVRDDNARFQGVRYQIFEEPIGGDGDGDGRGEPVEPDGTPGAKNYAPDSGGNVDNPSSEPFTKNCATAKKPVYGKAVYGKTVHGDFVPFKKTNSLRRLDNQEDYSGAGAPEHAQTAGSTVEKEPASPASSSKRGTYLPEGWTPKPETNRKMAEECPGVDLDAEFLRFTDYWLGASGQRARKRNWDATWRNWVRRASESATRGSSSRQTANQGGLRGYNPSDWLPASSAEPIAPPTQSALPPFGGGAA